MSLENSQTDSDKPEVPLQTDDLKRRLRSLRRFRRQGLHKRALKVEAILGALVADAGRLAADYRENASTESPVSIDDYKALQARFEQLEKEMAATVSDSDPHGLSSVRFLQRESDKLPDGEAMPIGNEHTRPIASTIPRPLTTDVPTLHQQIEFFESELSNAQKAYDTIAFEECNLRQQIDVLRTQILESRHETIELRLQLSDFTEREQAKLGELSWAERREQLIRQLEAEGNEGQSASTDSRRVRELIESTAVEVSKRDRIIEERDREIEELKMLLTRQSGVTKGLAVGASAIAGVLDGDELIREERENLSRIKSEWEEKLRAAELEISTERARLARQRSELELAAADSRAQSSDDPDDSSENGPASETEIDSTKNGKRKRRWLSRLGIREE
jgi:hypothetical protein